MSPLLLVLSDQVNAAAAFMSGSYARGLNTRLHRIQRLAPRDPAKLVRAVRTLSYRTRDGYETMRYGAMRPHDGRAYCSRAVSSYVR